MAVQLHELHAGELIGAYQIIESLGQDEGRMSQIYLASTTGASKQKVALKLANVTNRAGVYYTEAL